MVCLVNGGTTDVSEIVAACLQDHKRALIVGERSAGKGSYQHLQPFEGGELKITIASFWRPNGKSLSRLKSSKEDDEWGIVPHKGFLVKLTASERDRLFEYQHEQEIIQRRDRPAKEQKSEFKDRQLEKSLDYLRGLIKTAARPSGTR
jgi:carboxyl-terminal processing protease